MFIILPSPISELQHTPSTFKVLRAREHVPNSFSFYHLHLWTPVESIKELGGASDLLDDVKGYFIFHNLSFNFETLTLNVEACYVLASVGYVGICGLVYGKKFCINTSITNAEWHTSFLASTLIVPFNILV